jgi:hypothetical protein
VGDLADTVRPNDGLVVRPSGPPKAATALTSFDRSQGLISLFDRTLDDNGRTCRLVVIILAVVLPVAFVVMVVSTHLRFDGLSWLAAGGTGLLTLSVGLGLRKIRKATGRARSPSR